ncbi:MAG TPA: quinolinate synthase NadA [Atribacteraceae bacterium]|nr:quinolinate synthase NadA [Atribacteraceae bacterium]
MNDKRLVEEIRRYKLEKNAVILVHNYQPPEIQEIADFIGDSLGLSIQASKTKADIIVFCGVYFMAETAKILSPGKMVLLPEPAAGCPMADMINAYALQKLQEKHPNARTLCYVNTSAQVKARCDLCCTSANAVTLVRKVLADAGEIIFVPDKNLAHYVSRITGRQFITWEGYCPVHVAITPQDIQRQKKLHPQAEALVHPECVPEVIDLADRVLSTEGMIAYARTSDASEFIVGTEKSIIYRLKKLMPDKEFYQASAAALCPNMKKITLDKVLFSLEEETFEVTIAPQIISQARESIQKMLDYRD